MNLLDPLMASQRVWIPDPTSGFVLGNIVDFKAELISVEIGRTKKLTQVPYDSVYPAEDEAEDYDDNCQLMYLNEATLLNNVRNRYVRNQIYTYIANMLIAVNPYVEIPGLYTGETIKKYQGKSLGTLPPHVYAIGDKSFRDMKVTKASQSIIVSGESGAGKTESTKYVLQYLCGSWGKSAGPIEQKILDANPVLESFGNAKTVRNNNSSRFGKFIEIHFEEFKKVTGGFISHYLLEKSRICSQAKEERNYHVFYQLLCGAPEGLKKALGLDRDISAFNYLQGCRAFFGVTMKDPIVDDMKDFRNMEMAMSRLGLGDGEKLAIYTVVASVLHLGNVKFEDDPDDQRGGCRVTDDSEAELQFASKLMGVDCDDLRQALTSRVMQTAKAGHKGTVIMIPLKVYEACNARDALAKAMYSRLFDYIVHRINQSIPFKSKNTSYIGVLDIAGFEQQFFNERVLKDEQNLYEKEGLGIEKIVYVDNSDCIDLIESNGILSLLDEESKLPKQSASHFTSEVHTKFASHFRLALPRKSKIKEHREIRDDEGFLIRHFAGAVCYKTVQFIDKNNDALHASLEGLIGESKNTFVQGLFVLSENKAVSKGKLNYLSVASKFRTQLSELLEKLRGTGTSFIRCIKPNAKMVQGVFEGGQILSQLQSAGMTSVLELMQKGYPSRVQFSSLYASYKGLLPPKLSSLDPRFFCRALFKALGLNEEDFRFGLTRVFFRPGKFKEFDQLMRNDPDSLTHMVNSVSRWIVQSKWKKMQFTAISTIKLKNKILYRRENLVKIQKMVRMHLARKRHEPRYKGIMKMKKLNRQIDSMSQSLQKLKKGKEKSKAEVDQINQELSSAIMFIKNNDKLGKKEIEKMNQNLLAKCETLIKTLSQRIDDEKIAEEREKAKKIQEEMAREKAKRMEEEKSKIQEEENKKKKAEIEAQRKREIEAAAKAPQKPKEIQRPEEETAFTEQNKRDNELAFRLAQESNVTFDETAGIQLKRSNYVVNSRAGKKYDLSGWKYSELRDTINTSCEVDLLEACREEFHRRLKVYHAWKARNKNNGKVDEGERAPKSVYQYQHTSSSPVPPAGQTPQRNRYFRIPFTKDGQNKGLWYAHFDGEFIQRQMEIHPGKEPVLLIAGRDDMQMCELKLAETGLTKKRGAEILEHDFEKDWTKYGGYDFKNGN